MCFGAESRPPLPPIRGGAADGRELRLASRDGTEIAAFAARAAEPGGPGIVVIPDVRGLQPYYVELALRFAEAGVHAVAVDLYARTAGAEARDSSFVHEPHVMATEIGQINDDVAAAVAHLRTDDGGRAERVATVGFCFGGRISLLQAAAGLGLAGVIGFYPWPAGEHRSGLPSPADEAPRFACPVLTLYGGADEGIPAPVRETFDRALRAAGIEHRSRVYEGARHSFFDRTAEAHAEASADAWREMLDFLGVAA